MTLQTAWSIIDICMAVMTFVNMVAVIELAPKAFKLLQDYREQLKQKRDPEFHKSVLSPKEAADVECWD